MSTGDIPKTAVITPFGLFEWLRMPFGCTFQRLLDQILQGLPYCFVYVDDSPDLTSHLEHVRNVFDLLRLHCLSINPDKCMFAAPTVD